MRRDPAKAVQVLDLMLEFFDGGAAWLQREFRDEHDNRCLVDALRHVRRRHGITGDGAGHYLRAAMPRRVQLAAYNDDCKQFIELHALIVLARRMAVAAAYR